MLVPHNRPGSTQAPDRIAVWTIGSYLPIVGRNALAFDVRPGRPLRDSPLRVSFREGGILNQGQSADVSPGISSLELLRGITVAAGELDDPDAVLGRALQLVCDATQWPLGHAWVRGDDGVLHSTLVWHVATTLAQAGLSAFREASEREHFVPGRGLPGRVFARGEPAWIADIEEDSAFSRQAPALAAGLHFGFALPICFGGEVLGVLEFYALRAPGPDATQVETLSQVGLQLGLFFERQRVRAAHQASTENIRQILDSAIDAFVAMDAAGRVTAWNEAAVAMFGWTREEVLGRILLQIIVPQRHRDACETLFRSFLMDNSQQDPEKVHELSVVDHKGREFPVEFTRWAQMASSDGSVFFYSFVRDITARKRREHALEHQANYDPLTGLPNRKFLLEHLADAVQQRVHAHGWLAVMFVDLDRFKRINDSLGHAAGDEVLVAAAGRLRQAVRPTDIVARLSGDEFAVICPNLDTCDEANLVAGRIQAALADPVHIRGDSVYVTASIGVAFAREEDLRADSLLGAADTAMYRAKGQGKNQYQIFDERMRTEVTSRLRTESELARTIERGQLRLFFQPIVAAADGRIVATEALLRWQHPQRGLLLPDEFVPIAEETGLIVPIGAWVLEEACRCTRMWRGSGRVGEDPLKVSVNLSGRQLAQADLVPTVARILDSAAIDPRLVQFGVEITESVVMRDPVTTARTLRELKALGVHLSIDDFGTGYSSLAYLKHFPIDVLKIDRSFVWGLSGDPVDVAIVHAVTDLAHVLGLSVVAEGVETEAQAAALRRASVDMLQGFLYAPPQPPEDFRVAA